MNAWNFVSFSSCAFSDVSCFFGAFSDVSCFLGTTCKQVQKQRKASNQSSMCTDKYWLFIEKKEIATYFWGFFSGLVGIWTKHKLSRTLAWSRSWWLGILGSIFTLKLGRLNYRCNWFCRRLPVQSPCWTCKWIEPCNLLNLIFFSWKTYIKGRKKREQVRHLL